MRLHKDGDEGAPHIVPRSSRPEVRNPILALPAACALSLPAASRGALARTLKDFRAACARQADASWAARRAPDAVLWKASGVYAGHIRRAVLAMPEVDTAAVDRTTEPVRHRTSHFARRVEHNPLLQVAADAGLAQLDGPARGVLAVLLEQLAVHNRGRAAIDWARHKAPVAAYELGVAMYAAHLARAARAPGRYFPAQVPA